VKEEVAVHILGQAIHMSLSGKKQKGGEKGGGVKSCRMTQLQGPLEVAGPVHLVGAVQHLLEVGGQLGQLLQLRRRKVTRGNRAVHGHTPRVHASAGRVHAAIACEILGLVERCWQIANSWMRPPTPPLPLLCHNIPLVLSTLSFAKRLSSHILC